MAKVTSTKEWCDAAIEHLKKLDIDERYNFVHSLIFDLAMFGGGSDYEIIGIIEAVKFDLIESLRNSPPECDGDCENCDRDEE